MADKQIAANTLGGLPKTGPLAQVADEVPVVAAIRQGQADVAAGRVRSHGEVKQLFSFWPHRWSTKSRAAN